MKILGLVLAVLPLAFGALRAATTGADWRYVWVAVASTVVAAAVMAIRRRAGAPTTGRVLAALLGAAMAASATGFAQGATSVPAVLFVALGFAICEAVGLALMLRARAG